MAKIALSAASAALMIAAPFTGGASLALESVSLGLALGSALIPPKIPGQAPLQDLQVSSSADGAPIPFGYGIARFAGQIIWSPGITYSIARTSSKGGPTTSQYVYSASFAAAFGEGPATIGRLWGDSKLIYKGGNAFGTYAPWNPSTIYNPDDLAALQWNPGTGTLTAIFQCTIQNQGVWPPGDSLHWSLSNYTFWDSSVQYNPGDNTANPGSPTNPPTSGQIYACIKPSLNDTPSSSPGHWQPLPSYYTAPTLYPGNETQMPDPLMQGICGVNNTPAYRGLCYAVWESFPVANFGNRVPNLRAEVTFT